MVEARPSKRAAYREATRRKLLAAARQMFMNQGVEAVSMDDIAEHANVSRATIYSSGVSKTVRLLFKRETKLQIVTYTPLFYKQVTQITSDRWRID